MFGSFRTSAVILLLAIVKQSISGSKCDETLLDFYMFSNKTSSRYIEHFLSNLPTADLGNSTCKTIIWLLSVETGNSLVEFNELISCTDDIFTIVSLWTILLDFQNRLKDDCDIILLGPTVSESAYAVAQLIKRSGVSVRHFHTSHLPAPLAAEVKDTSVALLPPVDLLADAGVALIKHANWSQVVGLYQDNDVDLVYTFMKFQSLLQALTRSEISAYEHVCKRNSNSTLASNTIVNDGHVHLKEILEKYQTRIIFLFLSPKYIRSILCQWKDYSYPDYQWVIFKSSFEDILSKTFDETLCTAQEVRKVFQNAITIRFNGETQTFMDFLNRNGIQVTLREKHEYPININQFQGQSKSIANYFPKNNSLIFHRRNTPSLIPSKYLKVNKFVDTSSFIFTLVIIFALALSTVLIHNLTVYFRKSKSIRATGFKLQQLSFTAVYMLIIALLIYTIFKSVDLGEAHIHFCSMYNVVASSSLTLLLSTLTMHHWRLYRIFNHYMSPGEMLSNKSLILMSAVLTSFPGLLCILWLIIERPVRQESTCKIDIYKRVRIVTLVCGYQYFFEFFALSIAYNIILIMAMMILYVLTKPKIPKRQIQFRENNVLWLLYCIAYIFIMGYSIILISYYFDDLNLEYYAAVSMHVSMIIVFLMFLFIYPLIDFVKEKRLQP